MVAKKATKTKSTKKAPVTKMKDYCDTSSCGNGGCIYFLGFIGAVVYYLQTATGFWAGVLGILKALVWPAMLIYKLLGL